jgi:hypothetical protein
VVIIQIMHCNYQAHTLTAHGDPPPPCHQAPAMNWSRTNRNRPFPIRRGSITASLSLTFLNPHHSVISPSLFNFFSFEKRLIYSLFPFEYLIEFCLPSKPPTHFTLVIYFIREVASQSDEISVRRGHAGTLPLTSP